MNNTRNQISTRIDQAKSNISLYIKFLKGDISYSMLIREWVINNEDPKEAVIDWLDSNREYNHKDITGSGSFFEGIIDIDNLMWDIDDEDDYMFAELLWENKLRYYRKIAQSGELDNVR